MKKFINYTTIAYPQTDPTSTAQPNTAIDDAREAFLLELSSFGLQLKKVVMVCEAESRQVEEYYREKQRIGESLTPSYSLYMNSYVVQRMSTTRSKARLSN